MAATAIAVLAMSAVGWNVAGRSQSAAAEETAGGTARASVLRSSATSRNRSGPPEEVKQYMAAIRKAGTLEERQRATVALASSLPASELGAWLEAGWFDIRDGCELTLFTKIVEERWKNEDPAGCVAYSVKNHKSNASEMLAAWAAKDPAKACEFLSTQKNPELLAGMMEQLATRHTPGLLANFRDLILKYSSGPNDDYYQSRMLNAMAQSDPAGLEASLGSLTGAVHMRAEAALIGIKLQASFSDEIQKLWDRPDGLEIFRKIRSNGNHESQNDRLLDELPNLPPAWLKQISQIASISSQNYQKWLDTDLAGLGVPAETVKSVQAQALYYLAYRDPDKAIAEMGNYEMDQNERQNFLQSLISRYQNDPDKAAAIVAKLGSEDDRKIAQQYLEKSSSSGNGKPMGPQDWLEKVQGVDPKNASDLNLYQNMTYQWGPDQVAEVAAAFPSIPDDKKAAVALAISSGGFPNSEAGNSLKGDAIRYLVESPDATGQANSIVNASANYAIGLSQKDADAASSWVTSLPDGEAKLATEKNLAANWKQYDPEAVERWLGTLPEEQRTAVKTYLSNGRK
jgi:hypothetical protein